jgi:hypothetical protein
MRRITPRQEALLAAISSAFTGVNVHWDEERGVASSLRGPLVSGAISDADAVFRQFLDDYAELFGPPDLTSNLHLLRDRTDEIKWRHLAYQMTHPAPTASAHPGQELEVWGAKVAAHFNAGGRLVEVQSSCWQEVHEPVGPTMDVKALRENLFHAAETAPGFVARRADARAGRGIVSRDAATSHGAASLEGRVPMVLDYASERSRERLEGVLAGTLLNVGSINGRFRLERSTEAPASFLEPSRLPINALEQRCRVPRALAWTAACGRIGASTSHNLSTTYRSVE